MKSKIQTRSSKKRLIYLDYAASTPVTETALKEMKHYFTDHFGNPGSIHYFGQKAQSAIDRAREIISDAIGAKFNEIIFTSSATEANNLALRGIVKRIKNKELGIRNETIIHNSSSEGGSSSGGKFQIPRIIVSSLEHESILNTAKDLEKEGVEVIYLPVDREGFVNLKKLKEALNERTILVSVMYVNNEIGTIQPITGITKIIKNFREGLKTNSSASTGGRSSFGGKGGSSSGGKFQSLFPLFHTDAVQAFQFLDCTVDNLAVDLMTISSQKIYGPKGAGALYIRKNLVPNFSAKGGSSSGGKFQILNSIITGGSQEYGFRSGTENVPAIAGFGKAVELIQKSKKRETKRIKSLRDYFWRKLKNAKPKIELNGPSISSPNRLVNNLNIYFPGYDSQDLLVKFDLNGIAVSMGSACLARSAKSSYVIAALNLGESRAKSSLRFSLGVPTTKEELDIALRRIINLI